MRGDPLSDDSLPGTGIGLEVLYSDLILFYDPGEDLWTSLGPCLSGFTLASLSISPLIRISPRPTYRDTVILSGGMRPDLSSPSPSPSLGSTLELWEFSLLTRLWTRLSPEPGETPGMGPGERSGHSMSLIHRPLDPLPAGRSPSLEVIIFGGSHISTLTPESTRGGNLRTPGDLRVPGDTLLSTSEHSEMNDLWGFSLPGDEISPSRGHWDVISTGGCHPGDVGRYSSHSLTILSYPILTPEMSPLGSPPRSWTPRLSY
jgi:hypothetical protein